MPVSVTVALNVYTCNRCGSLYAVPDWLPTHKYRCPICVQSVIDETLEMLSRANEEKDNLQRTVASLKGAITRLKRQHAERDQLL